MAAAASCRSSTPAGQDGAASAPPWTAPTRPRTCRRRPGRRPSCARRARPRAPPRAPRRAAAAHFVWGGGVKEATKTPPSHGRIPDFFTLFRVREPRRQSQCHGDSIRRRWHYSKISTPATIQRGPRRPPEHCHHRPPPPPLRSLPMAPLPRPGVCARSQAAPGDLNAHLGTLPTDDALQKPEISKNLDHRSTTYRDLIGDGSDAPGCVRRSRADALVPLGAISTPVVRTQIIM